MDGDQAPLRLPARGEFTLHQALEGRPDRLPPAKDRLLQVGSEEGEPDQAPDVG